MEQTEFKTNDTFDSFVSDADDIDSQRALAFCHSFVSPSRANASTLIYGKSGIGKTHLLHAMGNALQKAQRDVNVWLLNDADNVRSFLQSRYKPEASRATQMAPVRTVVLIDNADAYLACLSGADELTRCFRERKSAGMRMCFVMENPPWQLHNTSRQWRRFLSISQVVHLHHPTRRGCANILKAQADKLGLLLPDDAIKYMVRHCCSQAQWDVGGLIGVFHNVRANADINNQRIDLAFAKRALYPLVD